MESETVAECNLALLKNEKHCDVTFIVGKSEERINCHQFPLMSRSPVFEAMFSERWKSEKKSQVQIPDVEPPVFRQFLEFIYGDKFPTKINEAIQILSVAHKYQVARLIEKCELLMKTGIKLQDAVEIYQTARHFNLSSLQEQAGDLLAKGFSKIIKDSSFNLIDKHSLVHLLSREDLAVDELRLFLALLRWSRIQLNMENPSVSDQRRVLKPILCYVRFPLMKIQDFSMKVIPTNILSSEESVAVFTYMTSESSARFPFFEANHQGQRDYTPLNVAGNSSKSASIKSLVLRGPNYVSVRNREQAEWSATTSWIVTLKLSEYRPDTLAADFSTYMKKQNVELFGDRDTEVILEKPFPLVIGRNYRISVIYSSQVYLPHPTYVSQGVRNLMDNDYISSTRLKTTSIANDMDGNPEFVLQLASQANYDNTYGTYGAQCSHSIRSIKLNVITM